MFIGFYTVETRCTLLVGGGSRVMEGILFEMFIYEFCEFCEFVNCLKHHNSLFFSGYFYNG